MSEEKTGWWKLEIEGVERLTDEDRNEIAHKIQKGYWEGQIIQQEEE